jgi:hypothetical protein
MPYSSPSIFLTVVCPRVRCIRGRNWRNFDAGGHPIVFYRRKIIDPERLYSIYDKEMLAIMQDLTKFRQYLVGNKFVVKNDHNSLKYFPDQKYLSER